MIKTTDYFKMSIDELLQIRNDYGYTREECKIFDDGIKVTFFDSVEEYEKEKEDHQQWVKSCDSRLELQAELLMINERVAVVYV
jgi:hypothetical protein